MKSNFQWVSDNLELFEIATASISIFKFLKDIFLWNWKVKHCPKKKKKK